MRDISSIQRTNATVSEHGSSPLHDGSTVRARVLSAQGGGAYTVSIAGRQVQVRSTVPLTAGQVLTAQIRLTNAEIQLVLQPSVPPAPETAESHLQTLLSALGLPLTQETAALVTFAQALGIRLQPEMLKKALRTAQGAASHQQKKDHAELSLLLSDKGLESGREAVQAVLSGGAGGSHAQKRGDGGRKQRVREQTTHETAREDGGQENASESAERGEAHERASSGGVVRGTSGQNDRVHAASFLLPAESDAFLGAYLASCDDAATEKRCGALTAFNLLTRKRAAEDASLHWIFLPFEWSYHDYTGCFKILFDDAQKKICRIAVNMKNGMAQNRFMVYYGAQGVDHVDFFCKPHEGVVTEKKKTCLAQALSELLTAYSGKTVQVHYTEAL